MFSVLQVVETLFSAQGVTRTDGEIGLIEELMTLDEVLRTCLDPEKTRKSQRAAFLKGVAIDSDKQRTYTAQGMLPHDVSPALAWVLEPPGAAGKKKSQTREELEKNFAQVSNIFELFCPAVKSWKAQLVPAKVSEKRFFYDFFTHVIPVARDCFLSRSQKRLVVRWFSQRSQRSHTPIFVRENAHGFCGSLRCRAISYPSPPARSRPSASGRAPPRSAPRATPRSKRRRARRKGPRRRRRARRGPRRRRRA